ncbi:MAG: hypothetical protein K9J21_04075 [Bacteroidales bacterium]|nr:hypothetical protein [Bacteroidales bacterium]
MKHTNTIVLFIFLFIFGKSLFAQSNIQDWEIGIHGGPTLFWGDLSVGEDNGDYLKKFQDENSWSFGTNIEYRILPFAYVGGDFSYGQLGGIRDKYAPGNKLNQKFDGEYFDYSLRFRLNMIDLIYKKNKKRNFDIYLLGGVGHIHYRSVTHQLESGDYINSVGYSNRGQEKEALKSELRIPYGAGVKWYLGERFNVTLNTTFNWVNSDNLDATTGGTKVNDYYSYTSLGFHYKFGEKQETKPKPQPEPEPKPEPKPTIAEKPADVHLEINFPNEIYQDTIIQVVHQVNKEDLTSKANFEQSLPKGMKATSGKASGAIFKFDEQKITFEWDDMPKADLITLKINIKTEEIAKGEYKTEGTFSYNENDESKVKAFDKSFRIIPKPTPEPVVAQKEKQEEDVRDSIVYRVQVRAIYNGKQSIKEVRRVYGLEGDVYEHFHKGYAKYSSGDFDSYSQAREYREHLRNEKGIDGAFVVAFHNGERLDALADVDKIKYDQQKDKPAKEKEGAWYKVQIAAISSDQDRAARAVIADKFNLKGESISVETSGGWHRYTIGEYSEYSKAKTKLIQLRKNVPDAFIGKYVGGKRVKILATD